MGVGTFLFWFVIQSTGCSDVPIFDGVSADVPTGSDGIESRGLVFSSDLSSVTADGQLRDFSPALNHGEIAGTVLVEGMFGESRRFNVGTDRIQLPGNETFAHDGPLSIALWFYIEELGIHQHLLACDDKFAVWITPQNKIRFSDTLGHGIDSEESVVVGRWYSLVAVWRGTWGTDITPETLNLYLGGHRIAGELVNRDASDPLQWTPGELYPTDACYIGFESHQGNAVHQGLPFKGKVDDLMIFTRDLSDDEISLHAGLR